MTEMVGIEDQKRHAKILVIVIILVVVLSVLWLYAYSKRRVESIVFEYNGFEIKRVDYGYQIKLFVGEQQYPTLIKVRNDPRELENISYDLGVNGYLKGKKEIYVTIDPDEGLTGKTTIAALEIDAAFDNPFLFNITVKSAFTKALKDNVVRRCEDGSGEEGVIWLRLGNVTRVSLDKSCVIIEGETEWDLIRAADSLVLRSLGIIK